MSYHITINNKKIYDFYETHKTISFEEISCLVIDILEKITNKDSLDSTFAEKILGSINNLGAKINNIDTLFENKFIDFKNSYTQDLNIILNNNQSDRLTGVLKEYNETLHDKTKLLFSEFFPKNNEIITSQLNNTFNITSQIINSSESRLQNTINNLELKLGDINTINHTQNIISENINHLINKFHGSSTKGHFSEVSVVEGLTRIYPYGNVEHVGNKLSNTGDILLTRKDKYTILIENKEYDHRVPPVEIQKFIDNSVLNKHDGIMISQQTQISFKDDFEININGDLVLIYICNMGYNMDKLRTAISIIDHLKSQIEFINKDKTCIALSQEEIDSINNEYTIMLNQKKYLLKMLNDSHHKIIKEVENMKVPSVENILMREYGIKLSEDEDCPWCKKPCKNGAGVSAHLKSCAEYLKSGQYIIDITNKEAENASKKKGRQKKIT